MRRVAVVMVERSDQSPGERRGEKGFLY
jgi:hypothetical protein